MEWFDWTILLMVPALLLGLIAQLVLKATYSKYGRMTSASGLTGFAAARRILDGAGLFNVQIEMIDGDLTDHFDPQANVLRLSKGVYSSASVAAVGVAAHECGHAIQYAENYGPMKLRGALVKVTNFASAASTWIVLIGLVLSMRPVAYIGLALFLIVVFFQMVTLPVEFNASGRAVRVLEGMIGSKELSGVKKVLSAAAMTYVAGLVSALLMFLRLYLIISGGRRRR